VPAEVEEVARVEVLAAQAALVVAEDVRAEGLAAQVARAVVGNQAEEVRAEQGVKAVPQEAGAQEAEQLAAVVRPVVSPIPAHSISTRH
jgi:hypothetical protein